MKRTFYFLLLALCSVVTVQAKTLVEGVIYLHGGKTIECTGNSRMYVPSYRSSVTYLNGTDETAPKHNVSPADIDSLVCWQSGSRDKYTFRYVDKSGWFWQYMNFSSIDVLIYSYKGYEIADMQSSLASQGDAVKGLKGKGVFFLQRRGMKAKDIGDADGNGNDKFVKSICKYISDDIYTCDQIKTLTDQKRTEIVGALRYYKSKDK